MNQKKNDSAKDPSDFQSFHLKMDKYNENALPPEKKKQPLPDSPPEKKPSPTATSSFSPTLANNQPPKQATLSPLSHKLQREIAQGKRHIDARIDLHQMTQEQALPAVKNFIIHCFSQKKRFLLVITGKGSGILQKALPQWLMQDMLQEKILHHCFAAPKDGGAGARYILLRKNHEHDN